VSNLSDLEDYLNRNLGSDLLMLRYTLSKIKTLQHQMDWNAYFESFAVHARNLYYFLTNEDGPNRRARDFTSQFKASKTSETIRVFDKVHGQILHLGRNRPDDPSKKANLDSAQRLSDWIENNFKAFIDGLGPEYAWDSENADPSRIHIAFDRLVGGPTLPGRVTTTNAPGSAYTFEVAGETDTSGR
jgi:hypothetical protein